MRVRRGPAPVTGSLASYRIIDLGGKVKKMCENFNTGKVNDLSYQSEGFPLTGYFVPACVGRWAWPGQKNCRRAVVVVAAVNLPSASFTQEKLHKMMFL